MKISPQSLEQTQNPNPEPNPNPNPSLVVSDMDKTNLEDICS